MNTYTYDLETKCKSSVVDTVRYNEKLQHLFVLTNGGYWYRYSTVPVEIYNLLEKYTSAGEWWNYEVKPRYLSTSLYHPYFTLNEKSISYEDQELFENSVDSKWTLVVDFTDSLEFTVKGEDVLEAVNSLSQQLTKLGLSGKYRVKEVKKQ